MSSDSLWHRDEPASPCIKVCIVHPSERICTGCLRTLDEIAAWSRMDPDARRAVLADLPERAHRLRVRRGGRKARLAQT
jgi:predicted Fe-S protein YdhL (DUF1289 family)